jgi:hypothetical protein
MQLLTYRGRQILDILPELAQLRIEVFRQWPYLYDGNLEYEQKYLAHMAESAGSFCALAVLEGRAVGAATAGLLEDQDEDFQQPLRQAGYRPEACLYLGESVLLDNYRGRGLGHRFFDLREAHGRENGRSFSTFCRVLRPQDHPLRPAQGRTLDDFWRGRGYLPLAGVSGNYAWKDVDQARESLHPMEYWLRSL